MLIFRPGHEPPPGAGGAVVAIGEPPHFRVAYVDPPYVVCDFPPALKAKPPYPTGLPPSAIRPGEGDRRFSLWTGRWVEIRSNEQPTVRGKVLRASHDFITLSDSRDERLTLIRTASTVIRAKPLGSEVR